jgi:hypothetical protein
MQQHAAAQHVTTHTGAISRMRGGFVSPVGARAANIVAC